MAFLILPTVVLFTTLVHVVGATVPSTACTSFVLNIPCDCTEKPRLPSNDSTYSVVVTGDFNNTLAISYNHPLMAATVSVAFPADGNSSSPVFTCIWMGKKNRTTCKKKYAINLAQAFPVLPGNASLFNGTNKVSYPILDGRTCNTSSLNIFKYSPAPYCGESKVLHCICDHSNASCDIPKGDFFGLSCVYEFQPRISTTFGTCNGNRTKHRFTVDDLYGPLKMEVNPHITDANVRVYTDHHELAMMLYLCDPAECHSYKCRQLSSECRQKICCRLVYQNGAFKEYQLSQLDAAKQYNLSLEYMSSISPKRSAALTFITLAQVPTKKVSDLECAVKDGMVNLSWKESNPNVSSYMISYAHGSSLTLERVFLLNSSLSRHTAKLENVPVTDATFFVKPCSTGGCLKDNSWCDLPSSNSQSQSNASLSVVEIVGIVIVVVAVLSVALACSYFVRRSSKGAAELTALENCNGCGGEDEIIRLSTIFPRGLESLTKSDDDSDYENSTPLRTFDRG